MKRNPSRDSSDRHGNVYARGQMALADDTKLMQELQITGYAGEVQQIIEYAEAYGFTSVAQPPGMGGGDGGGGAGGEGGGASTGGGIGGSTGFLGVAAEHFTSQINSGRSHGVTTSVGDRRFRLFNKKPGEVGMFDDQTHQSHITRSGHVRSTPNDKHHRHQVMKKGDSVVGPLGFGQNPHAYDPMSGQVRNSHSYHHHDMNLFQRQHPTEHSKHIITGDAIPPDGQGKSNIKHKVQLHKDKGHTVAVFGQNDSSYRHSTIHDDQNGITSSTKLSRAVTATQNISHTSSSGTISETAQGGNITNTAQNIIHNGKTNLNGDTTVENNLQVAQNIGAGSIGMFSDRRIKSQFILFDGALELAMRLTVCRFRVHDAKFRKGKLKVNRRSRKSLGAIAQDLRRIVPEIVHGDEDKEILTVEEGKIAYIAIAALQELHRKMCCENGELKARIDDLEDIVAEMGG